CFERGNFSAAYATCACYPAQSFFCDFQCGFAGEHASDGRLSSSIEALNRFLVQLAVAGKSGAARQTSGTLRVGDQLSQPEQDVLIASETADAGFLHHLSQSVKRESTYVGTNVGILHMQRLEFPRLVVVVLAATFEVLLPAIAADGHLHDFRGAFVDDGDAHVTLDLFDEVIVSVAIAAERLNSGFRRCIPGF